MSTPKVRRIAILGSRSVGKSSLTLQFIEGHFAEGSEYCCEIIDTAGQDEFSILNSKHALGIHGYVLVYSLSSRQSFETVKTIHDKILNITGLDWVPCVLVANKLDLLSLRQVKEIEGKELAKEWKTSAKHGQNISKLFELVLGEIEKTEESTNNQANGCVIL